ncbi:hypothetical protein LLS47_02735 [Rouxiella badensis]|uniref:hypothetical protein n=1 Tax=Rouxiella badensis TaxID=1646377 RepID=UPI001B54C4A8|nr:hypothetical protein [Rouxiella badensis]MCC3703434.1 hypothetical protein [Rouxiella badensis]MCC3731857.1 hypothetical protein [Rouxiella badensis]MCC3746638.1 hypothetical protein [Rouxiella badensis]MCC3757246.1 hypothetical protein [Rouxiella badensis]
MTISRRRFFSWLVPSALAGWMGGRAQAYEPVQHAQATQAQLSAASAVQQLNSNSGAGLSGYAIRQKYTRGTVGAKLNHFITIEDFADENSAAGDWSSAIKAAIDYAVEAGIHDVYGTGTYTLSSPVVISGILGNKGLNLSLSHLIANKDWPQNYSLWDAKPMILIGDDTQVTGLNLRINMLNGAGRADGIRANQAGFSLSHLHIGDARDCIRVIANGEQIWPNASVQITGDFWTENWLGVYLSRGTKGTSPISEAWKIDVKFIANNRYGGILIRGGSQYTQIAGDYDYNGRYLSMVQVDSLDGLKRGMFVTNGRANSEVLMAFQDQHKSWLMLMEVEDVSAHQGTNSSFQKGQTLKASRGSSPKRRILAAHRCADNESGTNYIDILHDFEGEPFAKIQAVLGYCSGIYGSMMFTSFITAQNSFSSTTDNLRGLGITNSGTILALYNKAESDTAFANITSDFVNFQKKLYMQSRLYEGTGVAQVIRRSTSEFTTLFSLQESQEDRYLQELNLYKVYIKTNILGVAGEFLVSLTSDSSVKEPMVAQAVLWNQGAFEWRVSGYDFQVRQDLVDPMQFVANILRV